VFSLSSPTLCLKQKSLADLVSETFNLDLDGTTLYNQGFSLVSLKGSHGVSPETPAKLTVVNEQAIRDVLETEAMDNFGRGQHSYLGLVLKPV
jgi:hypothetical protein